MKIALIYDNFGPYHKYRLDALRTEFDVTGVEIFRSSFEYQWATSHSNSKIITLATDGHRQVQLKSKFLDCIRRSNFDTLVVPGWSSTYSILALDEAKKNGLRIVVSSDSQVHDYTRNNMQERVKAKLVKQFDAAFVAGSRSADYARMLGIPKEYCVSGMNVVDNDHFSRKRAISSVASVPGNIRFDRKRSYFFCPARLLEKKNISRLISSFSDYALKAEAAGEKPLELVLAGDGPLRSLLEAQASSLPTKKYIRFVGNVSYEDMPTYYQGAISTVLPSISEPWGLIVNESFAAGTPVLISKTAGASEVVDQCSNGLKIEPSDEVSIEYALASMARLSDEDWQNYSVSAEEAAKRFDKSAYLSAFAEVIDKAHRRPSRIDSVSDKLVRKFLSFARGRE